MMPGLIQKKAKTEESAEVCEEPEDNVKKADDSEVPSLPLGLTGAFEDTSFASLSNLVNENTLNAIEEMGFKHMRQSSIKVSGHFWKAGTADTDTGTSLSALRTVQL